MSVGIAAAIAHFVFWFLLVYGVAAGELRWRAVVLFLLLWAAARFGLRHLPFDAAASLFAPIEAVLDIALVFAIFKGDVRLS